MSPIAAAFARLREAGQTGLVTYTTAGDPDLARSGDVLVALDRAGADIVEVGVPFSDPLADGPVIQRAAERARTAGATLSTTLGLIRQRRAEIRAPIVVFTYANPVLRMGLRRFAAAAGAAGVDGALILDLPVEESAELREALAEANIDPIFLLSPTSTDDRVRSAAALGRGFLYGISRLGVTGARDALTGDARALVQRIRAVSELPVAVGFGVSRPEHVREIGRWADAAVVGSGLVAVIAETGGSERLLPAVEEYIVWLRSGLGAGGTSLQARRDGRG